MKLYYDLLFPLALLLLAYSKTIPNTIIQNKTFTNIDYESEAIRLGKVDYSKFAGNRSALLCVTFIEVYVFNLKQLSLHQNVQILEGFCDWAIVIYATDNGNLKTLQTSPYNFSLLIRSVCKTFM